MEGKCTVYFENPFWVGIFERNDEHLGGYSIARHVFGTEPTDAELQQFFVHSYYQLTFSPPNGGQIMKEHEVGYKRRQREARRQVEDAGVGTRAQRALQAERERMKQVRQEESREEREARQQEKYLKQQKEKKDKHRGR